MTPTARGRPFLTVERAVHRLTAEVAEWFGLDAGTLREGERADFVVIDPAGLDESVDGYHEEKVPFYGGLSRMVNRNDAAVVATGVGGTVVYRNGEFREGYGTTVKSGRFIAGRCANPRKLLPDMARTQQQRREETIARLLDASIDTIVEVGYARASAAVIAKRAQVSDGALFRHFPTMGDFMAATAHEVMRRQLDLFTKRVAEIPADKPALEAALTILRDVTGNATNTVMYELLVAARTDEKLQGHFARGARRVRRQHLRHRQGTAGADQFPEETLRGAGRDHDEHVRRRRARPGRACRSQRSRPNESRCWRALLGGRALALLGHSRGLQAPRHVPAARTSARGP